MNSKTILARIDAMLDMAKDNEKYAEECWQDAVAASHENDWHACLNYKKSAASYRKCADKMYENVNSLLDYAMRSLNP